MSKVQFKASPRKFNNGSYLLIPATPSDKQVLDRFCTNIGQNYVTVTVNRNRGTKSYDQVKTIFALINIRFELQYHRLPTDKEQAMVYSSFLWKYADKIPNPLNPDEEIPVSLSEMSKSQAASFINSIIADIYEYAGDSLTDTQMVELKEVFEEFQSANYQGIGNPVDYDKEGNLLSMDEWRTKNHFSFASGVNTEDLQLHHILGKKAHSAFRDCAWNWIMLTDYEHNRIIHARGGWQKFLELFPHCAPRIKNAYDMAHELYPHEIQVAFIKLGIIDEYSDEVTTEDASDTEPVVENNSIANGPSFDTMKPIEKETVYNGDIF